MYISHIRTPENITWFNMSLFSLLHSDKRKYVDDLEWLLEYDYDMIYDYDDWPYAQISDLLLNLQYSRTSGGDQRTGNFVPAELVHSSSSTYLNGKQIRSLHLLVKQRVLFKATYSVVQVCIVSVCMLPGYGAHDLGVDSTMLHQLVSIGTGYI